MVPSTTGGEPGRDCVRRFREHGRIASGVCSGDNGYPSPLGARDRGLVRVAMYGAQPPGESAARRLFRGQKPERPRPFRIRAD